MSCHASGDDGRMNVGRHAQLPDFAATRDRRQLYARDTRLSADAPLRFIREGEAERLRAECRSGILVCPVPDCADPRYTTASGTKRDHFRHLSLVAGVHAPESYYHFAAKHLVGDWARRQHADATVHVDDHRIGSDSGSVQVPDVLIEFPDGRRFAVEIQYAPITRDDWWRRHNGYQQQGIVDIWLWGHERRYLREARDHANRIHLGPVPFELQRAGVPLHWINPDEGLIASVRDASDPWTEAERRHGRRGKPQWESVSLAFEPLAACRIDGDQFVTPLMTYEAEHRSEIAHELLQQRDEERRQREARQKAREKEARRHEQRRAYAQRMADEEYERRVRPAVVKRLAGALDAIEVALPWDRAIYRSPAHWHAKLFELFIEGHIGEIFTFADVMSQLIDRLEGRIDEMPMAAYDYLRFLERSGYLACRRDDRQLITDVVVLADASNPPGSDGSIPSPERGEALPGVDRPRGAREWAAVLRQDSVGQQDETADVQPVPAGKPQAFPDSVLPVVEGANAAADHS